MLLCHVPWNHPCCIMRRSAHGMAGNPAGLTGCDRQHLAKIFPHLTQILAISSNQECGPQWGRQMDVNSPRNSIQWKSESFLFSTWCLSCWWFCCAQLLFLSISSLLWVVRRVSCHLFWHNSWLSHEGLITCLVQKCCQLTADGIAVNSFYMRWIVNYMKRCLDSVFMFREAVF